MKFKIHSIVFAILMLIFSSVLSAEEFSATKEGTEFSQWNKLDILFPLVLSLNKDFLAKNENPFSYIFVEYTKFSEWKKLIEKTAQPSRQRNYDEVVKWAEKSYDYARQHVTNKNHWQIYVMISAAIKSLALFQKSVEVYYKEGLEESFKESLNLISALKMFFYLLSSNEPQIDLFFLKLLGNLKHNFHSYLTLIELSIKAKLAFLQEEYDEALKWVEESYPYVQQNFDVDQNQILKITVINKTFIFFMKVIDAYNKGDKQAFLESVQKMSDLMTTNQPIDIKNQLTSLNLALLVAAHASQDHFSEFENWQQWQKQALSTTGKIKNKKVNIDKTNQNITFPPHFIHLELLQDIFLNSLNSQDLLFSNQGIFSALGNVFFAQEQLLPQEFQEDGKEEAKDQSLLKFSKILIRILPFLNSPSSQLKKQKYAVKPEKHILYQLIDMTLDLNLIETLKGSEKCKESIYHEALLDELSNLEQKESYSSQSDFIFQRFVLSALYLSQCTVSKILLQMDKIHLKDKKILGAEHPFILGKQLVMAEMYYFLRRYKKSASLYEEILHFMEKVFGYESPKVLNAYIKYAICLVKLNQPQKSLELLKMIDSRQLFYAKSQFYSIEKEPVRRLFLINSMFEFQNIVFSLADHYQTDNKITQFAANVLLRRKQLQTDEEAIISKLSHSKNKTIADLSRKIQHKRALLSHQIHQETNPNNPNIFKIIKELEPLELELAQSARIENAHEKKVIEAKKRIQEAESQLSEREPDYQSHLEVMKANIEQVRDKLPPNTALIEFRLHYPFDLSRGDFSEDADKEASWTVFLLRADPKQKLILKKIGPVQETLKLWNNFQQRQAEQKEHKQELNDYAKQLYQNLFGAFDEHIKQLDAVYIAPDSFLNLIPYSRLILPDGRYWIQRQTLRQVQTGRDLLREKPKPSSDLLVAIGGVNFYDFPNKKMRHQQTENDRGSTKISSFKGLEHSRSEVKEIAELYNNSHPKQFETWTGKNASEGRLKGLTKVPRVLHLATHAFYLEQKADELGMIRPFTLSGIALAGAKRGLKGKFDDDGEDGILYALEALNLNLTGTELVVLSACETGQGVIDYSEGVYGLVRAFKISGAYRLLMTLWNVNDKATKSFMIDFYKKLLETDKDGNQKYWDDPAKALQETQKYYINHPTENKWRDPKVWSAYVLVGP
jgi:CHAT domain-containing protein